MAQAGMSSSKAHGGLFANGIWRMRAYRTSAGEWKGLFFDADLINDLLHPLAQYRDKIDGAKHPNQNGHQKRRAKHRPQPKGQSAVQLKCAQFPQAVMQADKTVVIHPRNLVPQGLHLGR